MTPAAFEPAIPTSGGPQTHALDRGATGIGDLSNDLRIKSYMNFLRTKLTDHSIKLSQFRKLVVEHLVISFPSIYSITHFLEYNLILYFRLFVPSVRGVADELE